MSPALLAYRFVFPALWIAWIGYWWVMARDVKAVARQESDGSRLLHVVPLVLAALLLWPDHVGVAALDRPIGAWSPWRFWCGALITAVGLVFSVWARRQLGRNWSATVTVKQDHELVETGPYRLVRHPIYTGLLLGFIGSALARGAWSGVLAVVIVIAALWRKLRLEERWMQDQFGDRYVAYRQRVAALIPFLL